MTAHAPTTCGACTPETGADWTLYVTAPVLPEPMHHGDSRETCYCGADIAAGYDHDCDPARPALHYWCERCGATARPCGCS